MKKPAPLPPQFPEREPFARALFAEAARHLYDARILHKNGRYPGAITSSMKAIELSLKSLLVLDGAAGWIDGLFQKHTVFTDIICKYPLLHSHRDALSTHNAWLDPDIQLIEKLIPSKPDAKNVALSEAANTEYPFFAKDAFADPRLYAPSSHFDRADSEKYFRTARDLLIALQAVYPEIGAWKVSVCRDI